MENSQLRQMARQRLKGNWGQPILVVILYTIITTLASKTGLIEKQVLFLDIPLTYTKSTPTTYLVMLLALPIAYGLAIYFLDFARERQVSVGTLFSGYKDAPRMIINQILIGLYTFLWTLLFVIPGIVKSISYSMSLYILKDNPDISANKAITLSKEMMKGHKAEYFLLQLSFIGWFILSAFTFGIGLIWLIPYIHTTNAYFYEDIKRQNIYSQEVV